MNNYIFKELTGFQKLLIYILLLISGSILVTFVGIEFIKLTLGIDISSINQSVLIDNNSIRALKIITIFSHLGTFIIPSLIFLFFFNTSIHQFWGIKKQRQFIFLAIPFFFIGTSILGEWSLILNHKIDFQILPQYISDYIYNSQKSSELLIKQFIGITWQSYTINILIIAIVPAIGEELTFRAVLQPLFINTFKNKQASILFVAFIFAFIHFQFMDFFPRFLLGVIYGYIFYYTKNIFYSIILHFLNNFTALTLLFLNLKYDVNIGSIFTPYYLSILVGVLFTWKGFSLIKNERFNINHNSK